MRDLITAVKAWRAAHSATWAECFGLEHDGEFVIHPMAGLSGPIARRIAECLNEYDQQRIRSAIVDPPAVLGAGSAPEGSVALKDVADERQRQISAEGWTSEHDDTHKSGEMALAAAMYALPHSFRRMSVLADHERPIELLAYIWPWLSRWWKPTTRRRDLVKAGALIIAEIERLDRAAAPAAPGEAP